MALVSDLMGAIRLERGGNRGMNKGLAAAGAILVISARNALANEAAANASWNDFCRDGLNKTDMTGPSNLGLSAQTDN
ncbi:hypothetical protein D1224_10475 [Henriciella barbarensis]|uniref:Uncharacterized protein n=2 Tax=Hyphomonadaceae TaxID=69657 RepID=A0A399R4J9_9PROT|nr:hypothetical protein D1224_10475 [Henriciella barbarensis]